MPIRPPTTAKPAMTPPLSDVPEPPVDAELVALPDKVSMTLCATHSPNVHPLSARPEDPNTCWMVSCRNAHVAVLSEEGGSQDMPSVPLSVSMIPVRFDNETAPQNVVPARHVHFRFWQFQSALPSPEPRSCWHESAVQ